MGRFASFGGVGRKRIDVLVKVDGAWRLRRGAFRETVAGARLPRQETGGSTLNRLLATARGRERVDGSIAMQWKRCAQMLCTEKTGLEGGRHKKSIDLGDGSPTD